MNRSSTLGRFVAVGLFLLAVVSPPLMAQGASAAGTCIYVQDCKRPVSGYPNSFSPACNVGSTQSYVTNFYSAGGSLMGNGYFVTKYSAPCQAAWAEASYIALAGTTQGFRSVRPGVAGLQAGGVTSGAKWGSGGYSGGEMLKSCCGGWYVYHYVTVTYTPIINTEKFVGTS
jgi:hypothetical protein